MRQVMTLEGTVFGLASDGYGFVRCPETGDSWAFSTSRVEPGFRLRDHAAVEIEVVGGKVTAVRPSLPRRHAKPIASSTAA